MILFFKILFLSRLVFSCLAAIGGEDDRNMSTLVPVVPNWFEEGWKMGWEGWDMNWDLREPKSDAEDEPKAIRNIFFIRHGIYFRKNRTVDEQKLTPLGREQAEFLGRRLADVKNEYKFEKCVFSTMLRARQTGEIIIKQMPHLKFNCKLDSILEEGSPYPAEPFKSHWRPIEPSVYHSEGARMEAAFRKYIHRADPSQKKDSYELIVCHANLIRYFVCRALQYPPEGWVRFNVAHTSITWILIPPSGNVIVNTVGDVGHLPPDKLTFHNV